jgi:xanthine dehydrogenase/oxidase
VTCREGGCGACVINVEIMDYVTQSNKNIAINSVIIKKVLQIFIKKILLNLIFFKCLFPVYSCDGLMFTTIEGVGSKATGYNEIQKRLVDANGTQCGWCTPGMVMNMYSLLLEEPAPTKEKIESHFDGHICRCTGYRPILDAMKSFAVDEKPIDIEELYKLKCLNTCSGDRSRKINCANNHQHGHVPESKKSLHVISEAYEWYTPVDLSELLNYLNVYVNYRIVSGNTGMGVYKDNLSDFSVYIDPKRVVELYNVTVDQNGLTVGSQVTIKNLIDIFNVKSTLLGFEYLSEIAKHLSKVANVAVRNAATWAGNLVLKHDHLSFTSDVFTCFETINANLCLVSANDGKYQTSMMKFLNTNLDSVLVYSATLPRLNPKTTIVKTFKIMPR